MSKTDAKTRQHYFFTARQNVLQKLRKLALQKHEFITDFEPNTTVFHSCTIAATIWGNNKKNKSEQLMRGVKLKLKTRNQVISSPSDEDISVLRKESRKTKRRQKQASSFEISRISTVLNYWLFWFFSRPFCSNFIARTQKSIWTK